MCGIDTGYPITILPVLARYPGRILPELDLSYRLSFKTCARAHDVIDEK